MTEGKIGAYYRLSVEDGEMREESNSITSQRLLIRKYISGHTELLEYGYCEFYDDGFSGTTMNRPGLQALLEKVKRKEINCIIVKDLSRFSRDYIEMGTYMEQIFPNLGVRFISVSDHYDSKDYIGKTADIDIGFKSLMSDFYCKDVSEKVRSAVQAKRKQGKYATGAVPFGYCKDSANPDILRIVPEEAQVVRRIYELSLSGQNLTQICRTLNDENVPTPLEYKNMQKGQRRKELQQTHKYWQQGTVRAILTNESYIGNMVYGKTSRLEVGGGRRILKPRGEWKVYENHHEPIISRCVYKKVQENFPEKKKAARGNLKYALKGKVYCGYCKRRLRVMKLAGGKLFYYCPNQKLNSENGCIEGRMGNEFLEKVVLAQVKRQIAGVADLETAGKELYESWKVRAMEIRRDGEEAARELSELTWSKLRLLEGYHEGTSSREEYLTRRNQLEERIREKESVGEELKKKSEYYGELLEIGGGDYGRFLQYVGFRKFTWEMADAFVEKIVIDGDKSIHVFWKFCGRRCFAHVLTPLCNYPL